MADPEFLAPSPDRRLAYHHQRGRGPTLLFLPGYASDMHGTKAQALAHWAQDHGQALLRFDWSGCGQSAGVFEQQTISSWLADARAMLELLDGPVVPVGSSMGGWIALLLALARPQHIAGLVLIAAAPDFTQWGLAETLRPDERAALARDGVFERANPYGPAPTRFARALIEDGAAHLLLGRPIPLRQPVRLLHGQCDADVPWRLSLEIAERLESSDVCITLVKDGDHRLSRPTDIARMLREVAALCN